MSKSQSRNETRGNRRSWHIVVANSRDLVAGGQGSGSRQGQTFWTVYGDGRKLTLEQRIINKPEGSVGQFISEEIPRGRSVTIWLAHGWEELVSSGMAEMIDQGQYVYKWACLDGARCMMDGHLDGRRVKITSLAAWTGGMWDAWRDQALAVLERKRWFVSYERDAGTIEAVSEAERIAIGTVVIVIEGNVFFQIGYPKLSVGAQARVWWKAWGGPRVRAVEEKKRRREQGKKPRMLEVAVPVGQRPKVVVGHEAHCCHGLTREQYFRGHAAQKVYVCDVKECYLWALVTTPLPVAYDTTLRNPSADKLRELTTKRVMCALVRLCGATIPCSIERHDRPTRAVGSFWAWLCGEELADVLDRGEVAEVQQAHTYHGGLYTDYARNTLTSIGQQLVDRGMEYFKPYWRMLYSSIVGTWAQRRWVWQDEPRESQVGRWSTWTMAGREGEPLDRWRVIGGRVQKRVYQGESPHSYHVAYALITSAIRRRLDRMRMILPTGSVLATACDSLWLTETGWKTVELGLNNIHESQHPIRVKEVLDDLWLDGQGGAVAKIGDKLYPILPGVPHNVAIGDDGKAIWDRQAPWTDGVPVDGKPMPKRRRASWNGRALIDRNNFPLCRAEPFVLLNDTDLPEDLLLAYDPLRIRRRDE